MDKSQLKPQDSMVVIEALEAERIHLTFAGVCCGTCARYGILTDYGDRARFDGYGFAHSQAMDRVAEGDHEIHLSYGGMQPYDDADLEHDIPTWLAAMTQFGVAEEIVRTFEKYHWDVEWSGDVSKNILLRLPAEWEQAELHEFCEIHLGEGWNQMIGEDPATGEMVPWIWVESIGEWMPPSVVAEVEADMLADGEDERRKVETAEVSE